MGEFISVRLGMFEYIEGIKVLGIAENVLFTLICVFNVNAVKKPGIILNESIDIIYQSFE